MKSIFVSGLGFGDEGKGSIVDAICSKTRVSCVVRFNGGYQAAHNVINKGRHHTFSQFGSGTFFNVPTFISAPCVIEPAALVNEANHLESLGVDSPLKYIHIDKVCLIATPFHKSFNRLEELSRGKDRHGSCGLGVGVVKKDLEAGSYLLRACDLTCHPNDISALIKRIRSYRLGEIENLAGPGVKTIEFQRELKRFKNIDIEEWAYFYADFIRRVRIHRQFADFFSALPEMETCLYEGAQGILLDWDYGFRPYTSWDCNLTQAFALSRTMESFYGNRILNCNIGVIRSYHTRHGNGPFPTEDVELDSKLSEPHNGWNAWQNKFRIGHFDANLFKYAKTINSPEYIAVTHLDKYIPKKIAVSYKDNMQVGPSLSKCEPIYKDIKSKTDFLSFFGKSIGIESYGPTSNDKIFSKTLKAFIDS